MKPPAKHLWGVALLMNCLLGWSQVRIENPRHLDVPQERTQLLLRTACRVVGKEFHVPDAPREYPLTLFLGEQDEHYSHDELTGSNSISLARWDEEKFVAALLTLTVRNLIAGRRRNRMIGEILSRTNQLAPIAAVTLGGAMGVANSPRQTERPSHDCLATIVDSAVGDLGCPEANRSRAQPHRRR